MHALSIDRDRNELRAGSPKRGMSSEVAGLLDGNAVIRLEQYRGCKPKRGLRTRHDEDLISHASHRTRRTKMLGDRDAEATATRRGRHTPTGPAFPRAPRERDRKSTRL